MTSKPEEGFPAGKEGKLADFLSHLAAAGEVRQTLNQRLSDYNLSLISPVPDMSWSHEIADLRAALQEDANYAAFVAGVTRVEKGEGFTLSVAEVKGMRALIGSLTQHADKLQAELSTRAGFVDKFFLPSRKDRYVTSCRRLCTDLAEVLERAARLGIVDEKDLGPMHFSKRTCNLARAMQADVPGRLM